MAYLLTGSTGFIGQFFIPKLLNRNDEVLYLIVREASEYKVAKLRERFPEHAERLRVIHGDITQPFLSLSEEDRHLLKEADIKHFYHFAAIYDLSCSEKEQHCTNIDGTRYTAELANELQVGCLHMVSSIAVAGKYPGVFREDMFEEAEDLAHPYLSTKHQAEKIIREECLVPFRIYRPGMVIGHSKTGEISKIDGPYYFFKMIQKFRKSLPPWVPTIGFEGGYMNIVPVDYVVDAMDHISHQEGLDGKCFHLTDDHPRRIGDVLNLFAQAGHAPKMALRLDTKLFKFIPSYVRGIFTGLPPVQRIKETVLAEWGIPEAVFEFIDYPTKFDARETEAALKGTGISVPDLSSYAPAVWDYWERNLDPDLYLDETLKQMANGKTIMLTGASSGIGLATAERLVETDCKLILVARKEAKLENARQQLADIGGPAEIITYRCDLANMDSLDQLIEQVMKDHGCVDILINNAGRSIRRSIEHSINRFHDYQRTMQLNYFGCLKLIMGFLPHMVERGEGHIINISSIGVLTNAPRFSGYVASKAALEAFTRCAAAEYSDTGVRFTTVNMPLVNTPMIAPTKIYSLFPTLEPGEAADMVCEGIVKRPKRVATRLGIFIQVLYYLFPKLTEITFNFTFRMFKDSAAAAGSRKELRKSLTSEQVAISQFMKGIHL